MSGLTTVLQHFITTSMAAGGVLSLLSVSLAVVGAAVVLLAAWLLADGGGKSLPCCAPGARPGASSRAGPCLAARSPPCPL